MTPCQCYKKLIYDYIDDELDLHSSKEIKKHLEECDQCERFAKQIRQLRSRLKALPKVPITVDFQVILRERIRRELAGKKLSLTSMVNPVWKWVPVSIIVVLLSVTTIYIFNNRLPASNQISAEENIPSYTSQLPSDLYDEQVEFMIEESPSRVRLARSARNNEFRPMVRDSSDMKDRPPNENPPLVPVNF